MNEYQRRLMDIVGNDNYIASFADPSREVMFIDNYCYSIDFASVGAPIANAAAQTFPLIMDSDSTFILTSISGCATLLGNTTPDFNAAVLVQILNKSSGLNFFNIPTMLPHIAGAGGFPFLLTSPRIILPRVTLAVSAQSAQAVSFQQFSLTMNGSRIYYR